MSTNFDLAEAVVEYAAGTEANWNSFALPIPANVVIFTTDSQKFKRGDGQHRYSELPDGPSIAGIAAGEENVVNVLTQLVPGDEDGIIIIENEIYKASTTKLTDIVARIDAISNKNTIQDANLNAITSQFGMVNTGITGGDSGKLAIVDNHKMAPGVIPESLVVTVPASPLCIKSVEAYSDEACTTKVSEFKSSATYYIKIHAIHDTVDVDNLTFSLTRTGTYATITPIGRGKFKVDTGIVTGNDFETEFSATVSYNADTVTVNKTILINQYSFLRKLMTYGETNVINNYSFNKVIVDNQGNIYALATIYDSNKNYRLVVKFDSNLNIIKQISIHNSILSNGIELLNIVANASFSEIYVLGSVSSSPDYSFIIKFDNNLNQLLSKKYWDSTDSYSNVCFRCMVYKDNYLYAIGSSNDETVIIAKVPTDNLTVTLYKHFTANYDNILTCIGINGEGHLIVTGCIGNAIRTDYYIFKFNTSLDLLIHKYYTDGRRISHYNNDVIACSATNIFIIFESDDGVQNGVIVKLDNNLNFITKKSFTNASLSIRFYAITLYDDYLFIAGIIGTDGFLLKLDMNLNIQYKKKLESSNVESFSCICINSYIGEIIIGGAVVESGLYKMLLVGISLTSFTGTFSGIILNNLTLSDVTETISVTTDTVSLLNGSLNQNTTTLFLNDTLSIYTENATFTNVIDLL